MRLTLRTLLAYLDDILEPSQAKEIGEKIRESGRAASLMNKVKDIVRRRRIEAPPLDSPGSAADPNTVAEYLDNTLPPAAVANYERICLDSDVHLAEVAACHQLLTVVLGESVEISTEMREHMYSLGAVAPTEEAASEREGPRHVPRVAGVGALDVARDTRPGSGESDLDNLFARRRFDRGRWVAYVVSIVVVAVWAYVTFTDTTLWPSGFTAEGVSVQSVTEADISDKAAAPAGGASPSATDEPDQSAPVAAASEQAGEPAVDDPIDVELSDEPVLVDTAPTEPVPAQPSEAGTVSPSPDEVSATSAATDESDRADTDDLAPSDAAVAATETPEPAVDPTAFEPSPAPAEAEPPPLEPLQAQYVNPDGILLHHDTSSDQWTVMPRRALIFPGEEIACPPPFDCRLVVSDAAPAYEVILLEQSRIRLQETTATSRFGFAVDRGRVRLGRPTTAEADDLRPVRLRIRDDEWLCELLQPGTVFGIEVIPITPTGVGDMAGRSSYTGRMQLVSGAVRLTDQASEQVVELHPEQGLLQLSAASEGVSAAPQPAPEIPEWLAGTEPRSLRSRHFAARYEKEFLIDQPISVSIRPVVKDRQPHMSELAVETLALAGRLPGLVDGLSAPHEESRIAAIEGIRIWLPREEGNADRLKSELENRFREEAAAALNRMLWGYDEDDARNEFTSTELIDWMAHDEIAVRELAAYHVHRLSDRSFGYRADRRADEREAVIRRWREYVENTGALVSD